MQLAILRHARSQCSLKGSGRSARGLDPVRCVPARRDDAQGLGRWEFGKGQQSLQHPGSASVDPSADSASADPEGRLRLSASDKVSVHVCHTVRSGVLKALVEIDVAVACVFRSGHWACKLFPACGRHVHITGNFWLQSQSSKKLKERQVPASVAPARHPSAALQLNHRAVSKTLC